MWLIYALGASLLWGVTYVLCEQIYKQVSFVTSLSAVCGVAAIVMLSISLQQGILRRDIQTILSSRSLLGLVMAEIIVFVLAELCIALSITNKNATLAGLVEISYPVFIALFAYLLLKQETINASTLVGAALIFIGIFIIYHFNQ